MVALGEGLRGASFPGLPARKMGFSWTFAVHARDEVPQVSPQLGKRWEIKENQSESHDHPTGL